MPDVRLALWHAARELTVSRMTGPKCLTVYNHAAEKVVPAAASYAERKPLIV